MNIINDTARGGSPYCVRAPPSLATEEQMLWERSTYEGGECMKMCCLGEKNSVVKGLSASLLTGERSTRGAENVKS